MSYPGRSAGLLARVSDPRQLSEARAELNERQKSAEGVIGGASHRRPERYPERGLKERRSRLPRNNSHASGEPTGRKSGGWDEADVGAAGKDAPVDVHRRYTVHLDLICRTAVYVTRSYGGVGGGSREASPYPEYVMRKKPWTVRTRI